MPKKKSCKNKQNKMGKVKNSVATAGVAIAIVCSLGSPIAGGIAEGTSSAATQTVLVQRLKELQEEESKGRNRTKIEKGDSSPPESYFHAKASIKKYDQEEFIEIETNDWNLATQAIPKVFDFLEGPKEDSINVHILCPSLDFITQEYINRTDFQTIIQSNWPEECSAYFDASDIKIEIISVP